jgi:NTP pyrophosphatase (non-canonical NTP hydrolase)
VSTARRRFNASVEPVVVEFTRAMLRKLWENRHKGNRTGWMAASPDELFERLVEEVNELKQAMEDCDSRSEIINEAADVANMAMMVADCLVNIK